MVKRMRRLVSGQTEVARICGDRRQPDAAPQPHTPAMTTALWNEWRTSKKLQALFAERAEDPHMAVDDTAMLICDAKNISESPVVLGNLKRCLQDIKGVNEVIAAVKALSSTPFNSKDATHEQKLEQLWQLLLPGQERSGGRYTREWGRIGFQQSDPASDFRGGGVLGLEQLLYVATRRTRVAQGMISEPGEEASRYPWACVGINLTVEAVRILGERKLDRSLYGKGVEEGVEVFNGFYADMFEVLHERWVFARPENLLAFPAVLKAALEEIDEEVARSGGVVPPGAQA